VLKGKANPTCLELLGLDLWLLPDPKVTPRFITFASYVTTRLSLS
jgi:hypothetical protein